MKIFCLTPNPHANGAGLNFKRNFRPAALACFTKRENFKNFKECEAAVNLPLEARIANRAAAVRSLGFKARAKTANREAVSARCAGYTCRGAKTAGAMPIDAAASKNISNLAPLKHCADRKNFKIFASDELKFTTHGEPKFTMRSMAKFAAQRGLKFEPCGTAARDFAMRDKILNSSSRENCASFKISSRRGEKTK
ncbi:hypothetical protein [Campylobacter sp.]|uniref:hypothetical protein n=1 Tax=Campylobacter sp. TaxID=205 RepID=UPI0027B9826D|nr:hypothetical protein [Campylobacter sp.]